MKTTLLSFIAVMLVQTASAGNLRFQTTDKSKEVFISEHFIQWIALNQQGIEIGIASGVFFVKGGNSGEPAWEYVEKFQLNPDKVLFRAININISSSIQSQSKSLQVVYNELKKLAENEAANYEAGTQAIATMLIAEGISANSSYYCESIDFRPHGN